MALNTDFVGSPLLASSTFAVFKRLISSTKIGMGGLSGKPLKKASDEVLKQLVNMTNGKIPIIASGGIFTAKDATDKFEIGASLIQVWTGFIYEGPRIVKNISKKLIQ